MWSRYKVKVFLIIFTVLFICSSQTSTHAYDPLSVPNNRYGIHILDPQEVDDAAKLVNSSGGDWGYVTIPIRIDDRDREKWFAFFTNCRRLHLIPILRLATYINNDTWVTPNSYDLVDFANFLNTMPWPTQNRYIILFNEPNHAQEWGGKVSPLEYATLILDAKRVFKARSENFFLLTAGLDMSVPSSSTSMDALQFYREMTSLQPEWYSSIDGLAVHAYPNPGFSSSVFSTSRFGITSFTYEENLLKKFNLSGKPIFITETGYVGTGDFYTPAFTEVWTQSNIAAITPFVLFAGAGDFTKFSFLDLSRQPGVAYRSFAGLTKIHGSPLLNDQLPPLDETVHTPPTTTPEMSPVSSPSLPATKITLWQKIKNFFSKKNPQLTIGTTQVSVEIANTEYLQNLGLSYRTSLDQNHGMLFIFQQPYVYTFWMHEMHFPLDFLWINDGRIVDITQNVPPPAETGGEPKVVSPNQPITWVLEVNAGFIEQHGLKIGDLVTLSR